MAKTNPIGVRFEERLLKLVMENEKLSSPQQVVNFLLEEYGRRQESPAAGEEQGASADIQKTIAARVEKGVQASKKRQPALSNFLEQRRKLKSGF